jgi:nucleoside-diphosphate-sugar epimerase
MACTVVITGATGNIGGKLRAHLAARGDCVLRLIDVDPRGDGAILAADLGTYSDRWTRAFAGADAVVHLAAHPDPTSGWQELAGPNVDAALHVYLAAAAHGVKRVVLASSVWVMAARFEDGGPILAGEPSPGANAYGTSKMFAERIGKAFAHAHGISTVALRLGACRPGANEPSPTPTEWDDACWISNRDICDGLERAIRADINGFVVVNLTSANAGSRWSLEEARDHLGYHAADGHRVAPRPAPTPAVRPEHPGLFTRLRGTLRSGGR